MQKEQHQRETCRTGLLQVKVGGGNGDIHILAVNIGIGTGEQARLAYAI
jgi:hypothetical protein